MIESEARSNFQDSWSQLLERVGNLRWKEDADERHEARKGVQRIYRRNTESKHRVPSSRRARK
jgi:hypothetical protein